QQAPQQRVQLAEALAELVDFLRYDKSLPLSRLSIDVHAEPVVLASKVKLQQVFVNLLKNAAHAIQDRPDGAVTVALETIDHQAVVRFSDNGCGIAPDVLARIWEPFFTPKGEQGNGLG